MPCIADLDGLESTRPKGAQSQLHQHGAHCGRKKKKKKKKKKTGHQPCQCLRSATIYFILVSAAISSYLRVVIVSVLSGATAAGVCLFVPSDNVRFLLCVFSDLFGFFVTPLFLLTYRAAAFHTFAQRLAGSS